MARRLGFAAAVLALLASPIAFLPSPASAGGTSGDAATSQAAAVDYAVLVDLNRIRTGHGLEPLTLSPGLTEAALAHTQEMVAKGYFAHNSADGEPFWKRIEAFYPQGGYDYWSVGENLFWASGPTTAAAGMKAWMASPPHRANILDPAWRQIGIATVSSSDAPGTYDGLSVTLITTDFGVREASRS
jgi:uncharacterized protein YkwD